MDCYLLLLCSKIDYPLLENRAGRCSKIEGWVHENRAGITGENFPSHPRDQRTYENSWCDMPEPCPDGTTNSNT